MGEDTFDLLKSLASKRQEASNEANELLWENIEDSIWWFGVVAEDESSRVEKKIETQYHHYHPTLVSLHIVFSGTVSELEPDDVHDILQYGAARRISSIYATSKALFEVVYPDREEVLSQAEARKVSDDLLLIYVHILGVLDALAIAAYRTAGASLNIAEKESDILKPSFRKKVGLDGLDELFTKNDRWFRRIKEELRNRYVHKVPPYVATSALSEDEAKKSQEIEIQISAALRDGKIDQIDALREKQNNLGSFFPYISFIESNQLMPLLPTVLDDLFRFQVICLTILQEIIPRLNFRKQP